jgi:low temperature requirement protein LtrA
MFVHLPLTMSIAAAGAAMVVVVEHARKDRTPAGASWLLTAAVAMGLVSLAGVVRTLEAYESLRVIYGPTLRVMVVAAVVALFVGLMRPPGLLLVFLLAAIEAGVWAYALSLWLRTEEAAATLD